MSNRLYNYIRIIKQLVVLEEVCTDLVTDHKATSLRLRFVVVFLSGLEVSYRTFEVKPFLQSLPQCV